MEPKFENFDFLQDCQPLDPEPLNPKPNLFYADMFLTILIFVANTCRLPHPTALWLSTVFRILLLRLRGLPEPE